MKAPATVSASKTVFTNSSSDGFTKQCRASRKNMEGKMRKEYLHLTIE